MKGEFDCFSGFLPKNNKLPLCVKFIPFYGDQMNFIPKINNRHFATLIFALIFFACFFSANAQNQSISGRLSDKKDGSSITGVDVILNNSNDSLKKFIAVTDTGGAFVFKDLPNGNYQLKTLYIGYKDYKVTIALAGSGRELGEIKLEQSNTLLKTVEVEAVQDRVKQKGDTTEYNSKAYKVNKDATTEDLVGKMPGITTDGGTLKAHGEAVQKVTIDGREFFGDDASMAVKNLPAEVVDKIQVYDRMSDQSRFTGFDDGNSQKTMNIITKNGKSNGVFGKLYGGYGTDDRYQGGGNINYFKGPRRISLIGLSNNINVQNFSTQDLLGVQGGSSGGMRGSMGGGGGSSGNFLVGQQSGINSTNSAGFNYSDNWGKKIQITGSYFYNSTNNASTTVLERNYFLSGQSGQVYNQNSVTGSSNYNNRASIRLTYNIDSLNTIIFTPGFNWQKNNSTSNLFGVNTRSNGSLLNNTTNNSGAKNSGYNSNDNLLFQHKFKKLGRTVSLNVGATLNEQQSTSSLYALNNYYTKPDTATTSLIDQRTTSPSNGNTYSSSLSYTEPITKKTMLQLNYNPSYNINNSDKETNQINNATGQYSIFDTLLSNKFNSTLFTQRGGLSFRARTDKLNFMIGANYQNVALAGQEIYPKALKVTKSFDNVLPTMMFNYRFSKKSNLRIFYRASTNTPSISQLQNVIDNSNPLQLSTGNPDLKQQYSHSATIRYSFTNPEKGRTFFLFANGGYTADYFANQSIIARTNTVLPDGILLYAGSKITMPVNIQGYWNGSTFLTYGLPVKFIKSNLNLNAGLTYNRTPGLINNATNFVNNYNATGGLVLSSNISEKVDFKISCTGNYFVVDNTLQPQANTNYYLQTSGIKFNWLPWKGLVFNLDLNHNLYSGLGSAFNQSIFLWNGGVGYKFLKKQAAEIRIIYFDLLNQNNSISRNITDTYVETNTVKVLRQYFLLNFTYTIRNFNSPPVNKSTGNEPPQGPPQGGGRWNDR